MMPIAMLGVAYVLVQCLTCLFSTTTVERFFFLFTDFFFFCLCVGLFVALALVCGMLNHSEWEFGHWLSIDFTFGK